jgi:hypothetical protein
MTKIEDRPALDAIEGWTLADSKAARAEGWDVWDCDGSENGRFQLCRCDDDPEAERCDATGEMRGAAFDDDEGAWRHVVALAREGSALHVKALAFITAQNPIEAECIAATVGPVA